MRQIEGLALSHIGEDPAQEVGLPLPSTAAKSIGAVSQARLMSRVGKV
jgi:hypothetical protein